MKHFLLPCLLFISAAGSMQATILQSISLDLSALHPGSTLYGTFGLMDAPTVGDTTTAVLSFSDPFDYNVASVTATISITSGTIGDAIRFSPLTFTNPSGVPTLQNINLTVAGAAQCTSYPCTATGRFEDGSPAKFTSTYTIAPASAAAVPEPTFGWIVPMLAVSMGLTRRMLRPAA